MTPPPDRLFNRNFTLIMTGQCVALLGSALYSVVLVLYLKELTGSATILGVVELLAFLPWVVLGPFAGTLVDRTSRKKVIAWSYLLRGVLMMVLFAVSFNYLSGRIVSPLFTVYTVFFVTASMGIIDAAFSAALNSVIPTILSREKIQKGNSLFQGMSGALAMIGNALGGVFFATLGGALAFLINGVSYLCAAFASLFISPGPRQTGRDPGSSGGEFFREMREGFLFIWRNEGLRNQTVVYTVSNLLFPMVMLALPFLVEDVMKLKGSWYGYLMSTLTLGSIAGYLVFGSLRTTDRQNYLVICTIFFVEALLFLLVSLVTNVFLVFLLFSLLAGSMAISRLINTSLKQKAIPEKLRGRVFGTLDSVNGALAPLSFAFGGIIIDALDKKVSVLFFLIFAVHMMLAVAFVVNGPIRRFYLNSGDLVGVDHGDD